MKIIGTLKNRIVMKNLKDFVKNFGFNKETLVPLVASVLIAFIGFNHYFQSIIWIVILTIFAILLYAIMMMAGYAVMKSLVRVSAGLTLLFFFAQTYCGLPETSITQSGVDALKGLLGVGFLCLIFDFCRSLYQAFESYKKKMKGNRWSKEGVLGVFFLIFFTAIFVYWIFEVIGPILGSLCIYRP